MAMNHKLLVPAAVRLDQARHKAKRAYGRHRIVVSNGTSDTYRENISRVDFSDAPWRRKKVTEVRPGTCPCGCGSRSFHGQI